MALFIWVSSLLTAIWNNLGLLALSLIFFVFSFDFMKRRRNWNHPPGPVSLPFFGTMLHMDFKNPHLSFIQLKKKYGNIFSLQNCWENVVVLNGYKMVKEALVTKSEDFADRPHFPVFRWFGYGDNNQGLIMAKYGPDWKDQKRFTLSILRDFGMGKTSLEHQVIEEAGYLCSAFSSEEGHPFDPHSFINNAVSNVICSITFGNRFDYEDQKFKNLLRLLEESFKEEAGFLPEFLHVVPFFMSIPGIIEKAFKHQIALLAYMDKLVKEHKNTWDPSHRRDITDAFVEEMEKRKDNGNSSFNAQNLTLVITDLFAAGTETTTTTLRWGLLYMILYPSVQTKVQEEIDEVIGKNRPPKMEDQANMHYTRAVIHEIQRFGDTVPGGVPHMTYRDTELAGYFIPKAGVHAQENSWLGWSFSSSSPASCSVSPSKYQRISPGQERTDVMLLHLSHTPIRSRLFQDKDKCPPSCSWIFLLSAIFLLSSVILKLAYHRCNKMSREYNLPILDLLITLRAAAWGPAS